MIVRPDKLSDKERQKTIARLWEKDPSLWSSREEDFELIKNRLGWLDVIDRIQDKLDEIKEFGHSVKRDGFKRVCLLGMGGSSLFALVISQIFGPAEGFPELVVLDTTDPEEIEKVMASDLEKTLFIVASKSGTTTEVQALFNYFWDKVSKITDKPGGHFVAITDPGTPLEKLSEERGFSRCFLNYPDIGGRYSALSYFGLIPASVLGMDIELLVERADEMRKRCRPEVPFNENPGYILGAFMGLFGCQSRDKLTILADPPVKPFGLWLEQLIAESSGKDTLGLVPVVGESTGIPGFYGGERIFVYMRMKDTPKESSLDTFVEELKEADFPVEVLFLNDLYDIGAQVFLWEFATALACHFIGVNAFNEPDVKVAKEMTRHTLDHYIKEGKMPVKFWVDPQSQINFRPSHTLAQSMKGLARTLRDIFNVLPTWGYLGFLPYLPYDPVVDEVIAEMRHIVRQERGCATVMGYGPRYLHSTGQLHKGGPISGAFLIFTRKRAKDYEPVPGFGVSFWHIQFAQAVGDFEALSQLNRRVIHVHLPSDYRLGLRSFGKVLSRAARL